MQRQMCRVRQDGERGETSKPTLSLGTYALKLFPLPILPRLCYRLSLSLPLPSTDCLADLCLQLLQVIKGKAPFLKLGLYAVCMALTIPRFRLQVEKCIYIPVVLISTISTHVSMLTRAEMQVIFVLFYIQKGSWNSKQRSCRFTGHKFYVHEIEKPILFTFYMIIIKELCCFILLVSAQNGVQCLRSDFTVVSMLMTRIMMNAMQTAQRQSFKKVTRPFFYEDSLSLQIFCQNFLSMYVHIL